MRGFVRDAGRKIQHRAVAIAVGDGVSEILEANSKRVRVLMYNASTVGAGSTVYVGHSTDVDGAALAAANGWPLYVAFMEGTDNTWKHDANIHELYTKAAVYGLAAGAEATIKMIEELEG